MLLMYYFLSRGLVVLMAFRELCFPKRFQLQPSQLEAADLLGPGSAKRGLLLFHRIGSGKTCAAIRVCEAWKGRRTLVVVLPASLVGNFFKELRSSCVDGSYGETDAEARAAAEAAGYRVMSYHRYVRLAREGAVAGLLRNAVLVMDEVSNVVSEKGAFYAAVRDSVMAAPPDLRVVLLSATPIFDRPQELALVLNLLRPPVPLPTGAEFNAAFIERGGEDGVRLANADVLRSRVAGLVSYSAGAPAAAFPRLRFRHVRCRMSSYQHRSYLAVERQSGGPSFRDILDLPNDFLIALRTISNVAFPERATGEEGADAFRGAAVLEANNEEDGLRRYSAKFHRMLRALRKGGGPAFVYSNFSGFGGLASFARVLEANGFVPFSQTNESENGKKKKRFAWWTGDTPASAREAMLATYNSPENRDGGLIKVILGSPAMKEGVSLVGCRSVHIMEPYWNTSRINQIMGRAVRMCSHKALPAEEREVAVSLYLAVAPPSAALEAAGRQKMVDEHIVAMAKAKERLVDEFFGVLRDESV